MKEVFPLVYFTHAELKEKSDLNVNLEVVSPPNGLTKKLKNSFDSVSRPRKKLRLTIQDENMNYEGKLNAKFQIIGSFKT